MEARLTLGITLLIVAATGCRSGPPSDHQANTDRESRMRPTPTLAAAVASPVDDDGSTEAVSVMTINKDSITVNDVLGPIREQLAERARTMPPAKYQTYALQRIEATVRRLARDALLHHEASKGLTEPESEMLDSFVDQRIRDGINTEFDGRRTRYEQALLERGTTVEEERDRIHRQLTVVRWIQLNITEGIVDPTRDQLVRVYESRQSALTEVPRREMRLIEVSVLARLPEDVNAPSAAELARARAEARVIAEEARSKLLAGADFAELAERYSDGLHARNGGAWGWVTRGSVRERWEPAVKALFQLPEIDVPTEIIETRDALFIVEAARIDAGEQPDFEAIQPELVRRYREAEFNRRIELTIGRLQNEAHIRPRDMSRFFRAVVMAAPQPAGYERPQR